MSVGPTLLLPFTILHLSELSVCRDPHKPLTAVTVAISITARRVGGNGVSRAVHSESCCQGIRRKQVSNVSAAGKTES